jgi:hypothetical protein
VPEVLWSARDGAGGSVEGAGRCRRCGRERRTAPEGTSACERGFQGQPYMEHYIAIFILGLFHVKMACADAVWQTFLKFPAARVDPMCLIQDVAKLRPNETGAIGSNLGFRCMHQIIT